MPVRSVSPEKLSPLRRLATLVAAFAVLIAAWYWFGRPPAAPPAGGAPGAKPAAAAAAGPAAAASPAAAPEAAAPRQVLSASGVTIRLLRRPLLTVPAPPYGPAYSRLEPMARAGDKAAQYQLGLLLYECRDVPIDTGELEKTIERTYETRSRGGWDVDDPAGEEQSLRRRFEECAGVPGEQRGKYRDWMRQAADAGLIEAQLDLPHHLPPGEYCQYLSECSTEQRAKQEGLEKEAVDYTGRARDAGSAAALWSFAAWYSEGDVLPQNNVEAYANFNALDQIFVADGQARRFDGALADLRSRMRPADLEQADARTREILSNPNCCQITP
jgi:TPR repeat protein